MKKTIKPVKRLCGEMALPGDKSISHRALMLGAIAEGRTLVKGILECDDCNYTMHALKEMGVSIRREPGGMTVIDGVGLKGLKKPPAGLYVGESGTSMRMLAGMLAGQNFESTLEAAASLSKRPMDRIIEPLSRMGCRIIAGSGGYPPLVVRGGRVKPIDYRMKVASAQVKSAILFAGLYANGTTTVREKRKSRDHTERMMRYFGADIRQSGLKVSIKSPGTLTAQTMEVPGDISSAAFFIVAASLLKGSKIRLGRVSVNPTRSGIINVMSRMGARIRILNRVESFEPYADIEVSFARTGGVVVREEEIPLIIDELPAIFVLSALSKGRTVIKGAGELKLKETDRIRSMQENLRAMGARFDTVKQDIVIRGVPSLKGARLKSFGDHRTCMAMTVASLAASGASVIDDAACVGKSFPGFFDALEGLK